MGRLLKISQMDGRHPRISCNRDNNLHNYDPIPLQKRAQKGHTEGPLKLIDKGVGLYEYSLQDASAGQPVEGRTVPAEGVVEHDLVGLPDCDGQVLGWDQLGQRVLLVE
jgi:hypothetical protein